MYTLIKPRFWGVFNKTGIDFKLISRASIMTQNVCLVRLFGQNKVSGWTLEFANNYILYKLTFLYKNKSRAHIIWGMDCIQNRREDLKAYYF